MIKLILAALAALALSGCVVAPDQYGYGPVYRPAPVYVAPTYYAPAFGTIFIGGGHRHWR